MKEMSHNKKTSNYQIFAVRLFYSNLMPAVFTGTQITLKLYTKHSVAFGKCHKVMIGTDLAIDSMGSVLPES